MRNTNGLTLAVALNHCGRNDPRRNEALSVLRAALAEVGCRTRSGAQLAEDAVQAVVLGVADRGLAPRERTESQAWAYVRAAFQNAVKSHFRRERRYVFDDEMEPPTLDANPEQAAIERQEVAACAEALARLAGVGPVGSPSHGPAVARRTARFLESRGLAREAAPLPDGRNSAEAKAEWRAVQRLAACPVREDDLVSAWTVRLAALMQDTRGSRRAISLRA